MAEEERQDGLEDEDESGLMFNPDVEELDRRMKERVLTEAAEMDGSAWNRISRLGLTVKQYRFVLGMMRTGFDWEASYRGAGFVQRVRGNSGAIARLKSDRKVMEALGILAESLANKVSCTKDWAIRKCRRWVEDEGIGVETRLKCLVAIGRWSGWEITGASKDGSGRGHQVQIIIQGDSRIRAREIVSGSLGVEGHDVVEQSVEAVEDDGSAGL